MEYQLDRALRSTLAIVTKVQSGARATGQPGDLDPELAAGLLSQAKLV